MVTAESKRSRLMASLGYRFVGDLRSDEGLVARTGRWRLAVLDVARDGPRAEAQLRRLTEIPAKYIENFTPALTLTALAPH
jgi:hypothetical protein